jgi:hypothetical protein
MQIGSLYRKKKQPPTGCYPAHGIFMTCQYGRDLGHKTLNSEDGTTRMVRMHGVHDKASDTYAR